MPATAAPAVASRPVARRSAPLRALSYEFVVETDDAGVSAHVDALFAGLRATGAAPDAPVYAVSATADEPGRFDVTRDAEVLARGRCVGDALGRVVWDVNRAAAAASGAHLLFHAGAVEAGGAGLVLPAASGSGKSTLTAALADRCGFGYLSDELVALDFQRSALLPYAKPITLKEGSFAVLPELHPDRSAGSGALPWGAGEWQVAVGGRTGRRVGSPCRPGLVVVPRYEPGAVTRLVPLSDTEAFLSLALHAVNLVPHGTAGSAALGRVVAQSSCWALTVSDLEQACALVRELVATTGTAAATFGDDRAG